MTDHEWAKLLARMDDRISRNHRTVAAARAFLATLNFPERTTR